MESNSKIKLKKKGVTVVMYRLLMLITVVTMIISIVLFFLDDDKSATKIINEILLCGAAMFCLSIPIFLEKKFKMFIPNYILILTFLFIFAHFVLGEIYRAYDHSVVFDKLLHTVSGMIIAMLSYSIASILNQFPKNKIKLSPFFLSLFAFCFTMTLEYLWEILEYLIDTLANSNMQRWQDSLYDKSNIPGANESGQHIHTNARGSGLTDTILDMTVNIVGALAVSVYGYIGMKLRPDSWILNKIILTDRDISAMKVTSPQIEVSRECSKKPPIIIFRQIKRLQMKYMITSQKAERIYLKAIDERRKQIMLESNEVLGQKKKTKKKDNN